MLKLSPRGNRLEVDGKEIALTLTESQIVRALLKVRERTLTKFDPLSLMALMDKSDAQSKKAVRMHIWRLRRKGVPIVTCATWGYRLE